MTMKSGWNYYYRHKQYRELLLASNLRLLEQQVTQLLTNKGYKVLATQIREGDVFFKLSKEIKGKEVSKLYELVASTFNIYDFQKVESNIFKVSL